MTISPHVLKAMTFDPLKDLTPLAPILSYANVLVINQQQPFKTLPELVAYAKANPGQLAFGSAGMGASNHLSGELFARRAVVRPVRPTGHERRPEPAHWRGHGTRLAGR